MEIWKDIPGYIGEYQASSIGNIRSIDRLVKHNYGGLKIVQGRTLKQSTQRNGYLATAVCSHGIEKRVLVHRLIAGAFYGKNDLVVNHKDGNKKNNNIDNLEYCTVSYNIKHSFKLGMSCIDGERHPSAKFTNENALIIRKWANNAEPLLVLAKEYGVAVTTISNIKNGRTYSKFKD